VPRSMLWVMEVGVGIRVKLGEMAVGEFGNLVSEMRIVCHRLLCCACEPDDLCLPACLQRYRMRILLLQV
jgi:hypothetical protein